MSKFEGPFQEAILALLVTASEFRTNMDRTLADDGITNEQYNILRILRGAHPNGHPCGEVANRMIDRSPDITRRIDALEKQGYVERERSREDRRVVITRITAKGMELLDRISPSWQRFEEDAAAKLTEKDLRDLTRICEKLMEVSEHEENEDERDAVENHHATKS